MRHRMDTAWQCCTGSLEGIKMGGSHAGPWSLEGEPVHLDIHHGGAGCVRAVGAPHSMHCWHVYAVGDHFTNITVVFHCACSLFVSPHPYSNMPSLNSALRVVPFILGRHALYGSTTIKSIDQLSQCAGI